MQQQQKVALSTLRNDVEGVASLLYLYHPGSPWPEVDPSLDQCLYDSRIEKYWYAVLYFLGQGRSPTERARYNTARPISVLGGVSDAEIQMLQIARGPFAKAQRMYPCTCLHLHIHLYCIYCHHYCRCSPSPSPHCRPFLSILLFSMLWMDIRIYGSRV